MGQMKDIAVQYVDYLVASGQISTSQYMDTLKGILDGEIGISKAWLISEIYDGDIVAMEAECGTMVRKKAELYSSEFVEWNYTAEGPNCFICGDLWRPGDYEGHDNICITCAEVWDYDEGGPEGEGYYRTNAETEECQWFNCKELAVCQLDDMLSCKACAVAYLTRYEAESDGSLPKMTKTALDKERGDIEGMGHHRWLVGEGYSGRAKCKVCGEIIPKGQPTIDFHSTGGIMSIHSRPEDCAVQRAESFEAEIKDYHNKGRFMDIVVDDDGTYGGVLEVWNPETMMPYEDDSFNVDTFEANYNPNQSRDSKGRWTSQKISSDVLPQGSITTPTDDEEEYNEHLLNVYEELYEDKPEIPQLELGEYQDIAPLTEVFDEGADAETLMMFLSSAANDEDFPDRYVGDEEFQEAVHQMVALLNEEMFIDVNEMFDDLDSIASLTGNPDMKGFVRRAQIVTNLLTDIKQQQTEWAAEELGKDSCCCGATSKNPCLCMIEGIMNCSSTEPMCPCYEIKKYEAEDTKTFEGRSHFPPGKHDVTDAEAALKYKHPAVTKVNSYEYLIFQEGTSNKFHVFFDTNAGYFNVYGSIGYPGRVVGPMTYNKYYDKMRKKIKKGYQKKAV